jgi:hypothetical protein
MSEKPSEQLLRLVNGFRISQALHVVATLGIADLLKDGPRASQDLAAATGTHPRALYRVLRALAAAGVFRESADQTLSLTPLGDFLRSDASEAVGPWAVYIGRAPAWQAWSKLLHSVRTGENAFRHVHGMDVWTYRSRHTDEGAVFDAAMTALSRGVSEAVASSYDFSRSSCVVDVGGGQGAMLAAIVSAHPGLRGILFDQPHVVSRAQDLLRSAGVADRVEVVGDMLVSPGGQERTRAEFAALFEAADFHLATVIPTGTRTDIIEAVPAY